MKEICVGYIELSEQGDIMSISPDEFVDKVLSYIRSISAFKARHIIELKFRHKNEHFHLIRKNSIASAIATTLKQYPSIPRSKHPYLIPKLTKEFFSYTKHLNKQLLIQHVSTILSSI